MLAIARLGVFAVLVGFSFVAEAQGPVRSGSGRVWVPSVRRANPVPGRAPALLKRSVVQVTDRAEIAGSMLDWSLLVEAPYNEVPNPFRMDREGLQFVGSFAGQSPSPEIRREGSDDQFYWHGNFTPGDPILWTAGTGPLTLTFDHPISAVGAQVMADFYGPFSAQLEVYSGSTLVGTFTTQGDSNDNADGSAVFLGAQDDAGPSITSIVFSLLTCEYECTDFAINQLSFR